MCRVGYLAKPTTLASTKYTLEQPLLCRTEHVKYTCCAGVRTPGLGSSTVDHRRAKSARHGPDYPDYPDYG